MKKKSEVDVLIAGNPLVDGKLIAEALRMLNELRREGVEQASYNLVSPFASPRAIEDSRVSHSEEPRMAHLRPA